MQTLPHDATPAPALSPRQLVGEGAPRLLMSVRFTLLSVPEDAQVFPADERGDKAADYQDKTVHVPSSGRISLQAFVNQASGHSKLFMVCPDYLCLVVVVDV